MGQTQPLFVYFRPFLNTMTNTAQKLTTKSVPRWCAWDSNPGQQDGRRRLIPWANAAPLNRTFGLPKNLGTMSCPDRSWSRFRGPSSLRHVNNSNNNNVRIDFDFKCLWSPTATTTTYLSGINPLFKICKSDRVWKRNCQILTAWKKLFINDVRKCFSLLCVEYSLNVCRLPYSSIPLFFWLFYNFQIWMLSHFCKSNQLTSHWK